MLSPRTAGVGETIQLAMVGWPRDSAVKVYLVTAEQRADAITLAEEDMVKLGEAVPEDGNASFSFQLKSSYEAPSGLRLEVTSGESLYVFARQRGWTRGTGPLVIR